MREALNTLRIERNHNNGRTLSWDRVLVRGARKSADHHRRLLQRLALGDPWDETWKLRGKDRREWIYWFNDLSPLSVKHHNGGATT